MAEEALRYENIIMVAQDVERLEVLAADADRYRSLESCYANYLAYKHKDEYENVFFDYAFECGEIANNLNTSLFVFENRDDITINEIDRKELNEIDNELSYARMKSIINSIEMIEAILSRHKLIR